MCKSNSLGQVRQTVNLILTLRRTDLLDYTRNTFDRDFLEFNVNVAELETALQGFINASFENITSTEHALNLLKQFEAILQRETLKSDLDSKYIVIFHNYGLDLETVQKIYDKQARRFSHRLGMLLGC